MGTPLKHLLLASMLLAWGACGSFEKAPRIDGSPAVSRPDSAAGGAGTGGSPTQTGGAPGAGGAPGSGGGEGGAGVGGGGGTANGSGGTAGGSGGATAPGSGGMANPIDGSSALPDAPGSDASGDATPMAPDAPDPCASLPAGGCCKDPDCPAMPGRVATCDIARRTCQYSCPPDTKACGNRCIPMTACCENSDCGRCEKCSAGACVPQTATEDLKNECPDNVTCKTGRCDGRGGCGNSPNGSQTVGCRDPGSCNGTAETGPDTCQNGQCQRGQTRQCSKPYYGCANDRCADKCPAARPFDTGSECISCGGPGQRCCPGARETRCRDKSWCCDTVQQKGCEGQQNLLNTCVRQLRQGDDCNVLRDDQCPSGTTCEFDANICCLPCPDGVCSAGGLCKRGPGQECMRDSDCVEAFVCRATTENPGKFTCIPAQ